MKIMESGKTKLSSRQGVSAENIACGDTNIVTLLHDIGNNVKDFYVEGVIILVAP